jgi:hypothetical protein
MWVDVLVKELPAIKRAYQIMQNKRAKLLRICRAPYYVKLVLLCVDFSLASMSLRIVHLDFPKASHSEQTIN